MRVAFGTGRIHLRLHLQKINFTTMPYITAQQVAARRDKLKKEFPDYKFSVVRYHHSTIKVAILSGPTDMCPGEDKKYQQVNSYYISPRFCSWLNSNQRFDSFLLSKVTPSTSVLIFRCFVLLDLPILLRYSAAVI